MTIKDDNALFSKTTEDLLVASKSVDPGEDAALRMKKRLISRIRGSDGDREAELLTVTENNADWLETSPGNLVKVLRSDTESMSILVRLEAGATFPKHYHPADEETYVVEGETWFGDIHLKQGDFHLAPKGTSHGEVRTESGCVLLIRKAAE